MNIRKNLTLVGKDLRTFPSFQKLSFSLLGTILLTGIAWGLLPDFADLEKIPSAQEMIKIAVIALFFPAICEETVFRGLLNPTQSLVSVTASTLLFVGWHPLGAYLFLPNALTAFLAPRILALVAVFGLFICIL